ncbi:MAG: hypothetical protein SPE18_12175, partial [Candidatus Limivicinus sp.]|nr:hypothetical protein [Candidatus Limivicinus sp.]
LKKSVRNFFQISLRENVAIFKLLRYTNFRMQSMQRYQSGHNGADSKSAMYSDEVSVENPVVMRVFSL